MILILLGIVLYLLPTWIAGATRARDRGMEAGRGGPETVAGRRAGLPHDDWRTGAALSFVVVRGGNAVTLVNYGTKIRIEWEAILPSGQVAIRRVRYVETTEELEKWASQ